MGHTKSDEIVKAELLTNDMRAILFHQQFIRFASSYSKEQCLWDDHRRLLERDVVLLKHNK